MTQTEKIKQRASELLATGQYPNWTAAHLAARREATDEATRTHRAYIDSLADNITAIEKRPVSNGGWLR